MITLSSRARTGPIWPAPGSGTAGGAALGADIVVNAKAPAAASPSGTPSARIARRPFGIGSFTGGTPKFSSEGRQGHRRDRWTAAIGWIDDDDVDATVLGSGCVIHVWGDGVVLSVPLRRKPARVHLHLDHCLQDRQGSICRQVPVACVEHAVRHLVV